MSETLLLITRHHRVLAMADLEGFSNLNWKSPSIIGTQKEHHHKPSLSLMGQMPGRSAVPPPMPKDSGCGISTFGAVQHLNPPPPFQKSWICHRVKSNSPLLRVYRRRLACLAILVGSEYSLQVMRWIPADIKYHHVVSSNKIDSQRSSSCWNQEQSKPFKFILLCNQFCIIMQQSGVEVLQPQYVKHLVWFPPLPLPQSTYIL